MEITYIRDLEHNYMIVKPEGEAPAYSVKMLETQPARNVLPFEVRSIDTEDYLYYRIDALQSLENRCFAGKLGMEEIRTMFETLRCTERELGEYLLGIDSLYLTPETVFFDRANGAFRFACMPFAHGENGTLASFIESLVSLTDPEDREAMAALYRMCECAAETGMRLRDMTAWQECGKEIQPESVSAGRNRTEDVSFQTGCTDVPYGRDDERGAEALQEGIWYDAEPVRMEEPRKTERKPHKTVNMRIITLLFAIVLLADIYIRKEYILTPAGNILSLAVIGAGVVGLTGSVLLGLLDRRRGTAEDDTGRTRDTEEKETPEGVSYSGLWDDLYEREEEDCKYETRMPGTDPPSQNPYGEEDDADTRTVLLSGKSRRTRTGKLYGRDNDHNCHVPLEKLPLTLGKLRGHVDFLLRDESVSRIHAHISRDSAGQVCVRDLNSTNGTFLNGVRLSPNETVKIREGDEICFGDMVFEYL